MKLLIFCIAYVAFCFLIGCFFNGSCYGEGYDEETEPEDFELVKPVGYDENTFNTEGHIDI